MQCRIEVTRKQDAVKAKESELWLDGVEESYGKKYHWPTCPLSPSSKSSIYWIPIP
jgi:hypothetical protein